jgi:hypothetical protein
MNKLILLFSVALSSGLIACSADEPLACRSGTGTTATGCTAAPKSSVVGQNSGDSMSQSAQTQSKAELEKLKREQQAKLEEEAKKRKQQEEKLAELERQLAEQKNGGGGSKSKGNSDNNNNNGGGQNFFEGFVKTIGSGIAKGVAGKLESTLNPQQSNGNSSNSTGRTPANSGVTFPKDLKDNTGIAFDPNANFFP